MVKVRKQRLLFAERRRPSKTRPARKCVHYFLPVFAARFVRAQPGFHYPGALPVVFAASTEMRGAAEGGVQEAGAPRFPPRFSVFPTRIGAARRRASTNKLMKHLLILH